MKKISRLLAICFLFQPTAFASDSGLTDEIFKSEREEACEDIHKNGLSNSCFSDLSLTWGILLTCFPSMRLMLRPEEWPNNYDTFLSVGWQP